jgi:hypothetical protein
MPRSPKAEVEETLTEAMEQEAPQAPLSIYESLTSITREPSQVDEPSPTLQVSR